MIGAMKRHEIRVLRSAGQSQRQVSGFAGVSVRSVRRIEHESTEQDQVADRTARAVGRPPKTTGLESFVEERLRAEPELKTLELLRLARAFAGFTGGKSQFYALVAEVRPRASDFVVRFEGLPGEFSQHDFGHVDVRYVDGSRERVHFFASRLKWSRWVEVTLVPNEQVESLVRSLFTHFECFGGVPLLAVFDRPKTVVVNWRSNGEVTQWNRTFQQALGELGVGADLAELCWPRQPRQKGSVENLVGWVKGSFFKQRRFLDRHDLLEQLSAWRHEVNTERPSRATGVPPAARIEEERSRLRPLRVPPAELVLRFPVQVGPTAMVSHGGCLYSMPPDAIGLSGTLYLGRDQVRIGAGRFEAEHPRLFESGARSVLPDHRCQMVAKVSGLRGKRYLKRQQLIELGPIVLDYITELVHRRPRTWYGDIERLHDELVAQGDRLLLSAIQQAHAGGQYGAEYVAFHLPSSATMPTLPWGARCEDHMQ